MPQFTLATLPNNSTNAVQFSPAGTGNNDMQLTTALQVAGQTWTFVLTIPYAHWQAALAANSWLTPPADPTDAYNWFPNWQLFWNMLANGFALYALLQDGAETGPQQITGTTPSAAWVTQYGKWFCAIERLAHPVEVALPRTYAAPALASLQGVSGNYQLAA